MPYTINRINRPSALQGEIHWATICDSQDVTTEIALGFGDIQPSVQCNCNLATLQQSLNSTVHIIAKLGLVTPTTLPQHGQLRIVAVRQNQTGWEVVEPYKPPPQRNLHSSQRPAITLRTGTVFAIDTPPRAWSDCLFWSTAASLSNKYYQCRKLSFRRIAANHTFVDTTITSNFNAHSVDILSVSGSLLADVGKAVEAVKTLSQSIIAHNIRNFLMRTVKRPVVHPNDIMDFGAELSRVDQHSASCTLLGHVGVQIVKAWGVLSVIDTQPKWTGPGELTLTKADMQGISANWNIPGMVARSVPAIDTSTSWKYLFLLGGCAKTEHLRYTLLGFIAKHYSMSIAVNVATTLGLITAPKIPLLPPPAKIRAPYGPYLPLLAAMQHTYTQHNHFSPPSDSTTYTKNGRNMLGMRFSVSRSRFLSTKKPSQPVPTDRLPNPFMTLLAFTATDLRCVLLGRG
ncbi:hypothetical protein HK097_003843 [Rhizophlyctis rosea]|uniref:Uncharacterized protein n=1 Tax=Rhizophlyctis rosea TaxID=64517 RepID=A0AAD5X641_9FUNG|nr:hypothetical protein HK097_003843 [Rhizophlyctis rosea]